MKLQLISTALVALCTFSSALDVDGSLVQESFTISARQVDFDVRWINKSFIARLRNLSFGARSPAGNNNNNVNKCPQVWYDISKDLASSFAGCNQLAANAIRFAFHDAAGYSSLNGPYYPASGGADGSLLLSDEEISRQINDPMQNFRGFLLDKYRKYQARNVSAADFVQAAGNIGVKSCPGGPTVKTVIGRRDSSIAPPQGTLPFAFGPGSDYNSLIKLWQEKGINPRELAALMGAHSVSRSFTRQENGIPSGGPQDSSPRAWDTKYFSQTQAKQAPRGVYRFDSDVNFANPNTTCGQAFTEFANDRAAWTKAFQDAMYKLSLLGLPEDKKPGLMDCTAILG